MPEKYVKVVETKDGVKIETDSYEAMVAPKSKYRSGVAGGTFLDKRTGARDLGFGLNVTDHPCIVPASKEWGSPPPDPMLYGKKRNHQVVETPQLCCTRDIQLDYEVKQEKRFMLVHQWFTFKKGNKPGCKWDEWLLFPSGKRYFFALNKLTAAHAYSKLFLTGDWPGHIKGKNYENVYLSYHGVIPKSEFSEDFPPETKFFYEKNSDRIPKRMIRAYQITVNGKPGPWLAGMTIDPSMMYQGWCNMRGYVCLIGFLGAFDVNPGDSFSNVNLIGFFDSIDEMNRVYDIYKRSTNSFNVNDLVNLI